MPSSAKPRVRGDDGNVEAASSRFEEAGSLFYFASEPRFSVETMLGSGCAGIGSFFKCLPGPPKVLIGVLTCLGVATGKTREGHHVAEAKTSAQSWSKASTSTSAVSQEHMKRAPVSPMNS